MNILSLFDGISCGRIALDRARVKYEKYFASEINSCAITVANHNYPDTIQLGDVRQVTSSDLPKIDLLIGGSPCVGFSKCGDQLNFKDPRSNLFFEFCRLKHELNPEYFLLENVAMNQKYVDIISRYLDCEPIRINSSLVSIQNRERLYWTNIDFPAIRDKQVYFDKHLYRIGHGYVKDEIKLYEKYPTLTTGYPSSKYRIVVNHDKAIKATKEQLRKDISLTRCATPEECEYMQTLPIGYTDCIKKTNRYDCIGNAWTVDIIAGIFEGLR